MSTTERDFVRGATWEGMLVYMGRSSFSPSLSGDMEKSLDLLPQEYPQYGTGDFRYPAYLVKLSDGSRITEDC